VALDADWAYVTASTGPSTSRAALYRSPAADEGFAKCTGGLPGWFGDNIDTAHLSAQAGQVALGTPAGEVWLSRDEGETFEKTAVGLGHVTAVLFA
jgi:hypothetical protein